jgi:hemoglobin
MNALRRRNQTEPCGSKIKNPYFRDMNSAGSIYEALGEEKIKALVHHFYIYVSETPELRRLYPEEDLAPAEERLFLFLIHVFGGPSTYLEKRGHPMLRRRHFQWPIDKHMRNTWLNCMFRAMDNLEIETDIKEVMMNYFINVANHMTNR